jgi:hypothetical protein
MAHSDDLPVSGSPNSSVEKRDARGAVVQRRYYGGDGKAIVNVDYDHDHGYGKPHAHDWDWTRDPPRLPGRAIQKGE